MYYAWTPLWFCTVWLNCELPLTCTKMYYAVAPLLSYPTVEPLYEVWIPIMVLYPLQGYLYPFEMVHALYDVPLVSILQFYFSFSWCCALHWCGICMRVVFLVWCNLLITKYMHNYADVSDVIDNGHALPLELAIRPSLQSVLIPPHISKPSPGSPGAQGQGAPSTAAAGTSGQAQSTSDGTPSNH